MTLSVEELSLSYDAKEILKDVSLHANNKEFVGIIGPNGSGKSTLLKCIYRILQPEKGCVMLDGTSIHKMSYKDSAKKLAIVAQHNHYNFDFSVREIVLMGRSPHKKMMERDTEKDYQIVEEALQQVGMNEFQDRNFSTLSGGEQQRVILARALAQQTPYFILDEPTNHLDITHQLELVKIVKKLDVTVLCAMHDLNMAAMFCDRLYVLKDGRLVAKGTPREVLTPERIREIYGVESEIVEDSKKQMHILFV